MGNLAIQPLEQMSRPSNGGDSTPIELTGRMLKRLVCHLKVTLNTPSSTTPAATPRDESPYGIVKEIALDLGGVKRYAVDAGALREIAKKNYDGAGFISSDLTAPAAGASKTIEAVFLIDLNPWWFRQDDGVGLLPLYKFTHRFLRVNWGDMNDLFVTPNATTITSATLDVDEYLIEGVDHEGPVVIWEPIMTEFPLTSVSVNTINKLNLGPDLGVLLLKAMSDGRTLDNTLVNKVSMDAWPKEGRVINIIRPIAWDRLRYTCQQMQKGLAMATGYAFIDLVEDGRPGGLLGTSKLDRFELVLDVAGAANKRLRAYQWGRSILDA